jgi:hypothetical protein
MKKRKKCSEGEFGLHNMIDLAALANELNRIAGADAPHVTLADVKTHVASDDIEAWIATTYRGKVTPEHYEALSWLVGQV